ncbi:MAG TPA: NAD-dependent epimerase/dehydratase family protein [Solirubrobacteraceae bacterium]|jgi:dihydroflavonol-4-reductase|nr:NAD-dependent epimerase/dehydratase family protein [Solirubrobacteraceae bacterium]
MSTTDPQTVLVTGGTGFLGGWCLVELLQRGHVVRTTVRNPAREPEVRAAVGLEVDAGERLSVLGADLTSEAGWPEAVAGCDYVLHVASPFPPAQPKDPDELIVPARDGTLRVLRASLAAGVKRVVVTSSVAAVRNSGEVQGSAPLTEENWTDPANPRLSPYARSKTIAEQAAWEFVREADQVDRLTVVNPSAILGPVLSAERSYSLQVIERMLGGMPGVPRLGFSFVDVRDVAALEVAAMMAPGAAGERLIAAGPFLWMAQVAEILRDRLGTAGAKVPRRTVPDLMVRAMGLFDPAVRSVVGELGQEVSYSNQKARDRVGWSPRPIEETIVDCANSIIRQRAAAEQAA